MAHIREGLAFDDVLIEPVYNSDVESREEDVDLRVGFEDIVFEHPIIPANMEDVAGLKLLAAQNHSGGLGLIHRFQSVEDQIAQFVALGEPTYHVGASVGVKNDFDRAKALIAAGVTIICVDVAHGDSHLAARMVQFLRMQGITIIAGNVATRSGARRLWEAGADIVKVGIGPGSLCTTRIETGCGVPQLTAIMDVAELRNEAFIGRKIIADGGIKNAGDCVKALCFADMVMIGNLFAGCDEAPGLAPGGNSSYKLYRGSSTHKTSHVEGVQARVPRTGTFHSVLNRLLEGIRSGCSYQNATQLWKLQEDPRLIRITSAGLRESYPHDVVVVPHEG
jgi:IMP dehydrogenase